MQYEHQPQVVAPGATATPHMVWQASNTGVANMSRAGIRRGNTYTIEVPAQIQNLQSLKKSFGVLD